MASARLRRIVRDYGDRVKVEHRCFALVPDHPEAAGRIFGSPEAGRPEALTHRAAAGSHPGGGEVDPGLMSRQESPYLSSMPGLLACKAAEFQGGPEAHWAMFDRIQRAHLVEARNIADHDVLRECAREVGLDVARWERDMGGGEVRAAVAADLAEARRLGISTVPTLVLAGRWRLRGSAPEGVLRRAIDDLLRRGPGQA